MMILPKHLNSEAALSDAGRNDRGIVWHMNTWTIAERDKSGQSTPKLCEMTDKTERIGCSASNFVSRADKLQTI